MRTSARAGRGPRFALFDHLLVCPTSKPALPRGHPQPPHEFVERALPASIPSEPEALQDFGARDVGRLAQPLRDLRRVLLHGRRAPGPARSRRRRHLIRTFHNRTSRANPIPESNFQRDSVTSVAVAGSSPGESLTGQAIPGHQSSTADSGKSESCSGGPDRGCCRSSGSVTSWRRSSLEATQLPLTLLRKEERLYQVDAIAMR